MKVETMDQKSDAQRLTTVDSLRGIACCWVAWFHFTHGNADYLSPGWIRATGNGGWLGVQMFFVLSGFIIPWSMRNVDYSIRSFHRFLFRRVVRLDPPYLAAIFVTIVLGYASTLVPGFRGRAFEFSIGQLLAHLGYLNAFLEYSWYNPVFWTLAIEFQWYVIVALTYPALSSPHRIVSYGTMGALCGLAFCDASESLIISFLPLFVLGLIVYRHQYDGMSGLELFLLVLIVSFVSKVILGTAQTLVGISTLAALLWLKIGWRPLLFLGSISYSLYLVHVPIGGRIINLALRFPESTVNRLLGLGLAVVFSLVGAWLLWKFVEVPAQVWSRRIAYRPAGGNTFIDADGVPGPGRGAVGNDAS